MDLISFILLINIFTACTTAVRLQKIFQLLDGSTESNFQGFLHVGNDYTVFVNKPATNDKYLTYELYETLNVPNSPPLYQYKPSLIAVSQIPVEYIKEQLRTFKEELYNATHIDDKLVPGIQVKTVREWQIEKALRSREENEKNVPLKSQPPILRTLVE